MFIETIRYQMTCYDEPASVDLTLHVDHRGKNHRLTSELQAGELAVSDDLVQPLLAKMEKLSLPMAGLNGIAGCDGATCTLTIVSGFQKAKFQWWCEPPEGWEALARIATMLEEIRENG